MKEETYGCDLADAGCRRPSCRHWRSPLGGGRIGGVAKVSGDLMTGNKVNNDDVRSPRT